MYYYLYKITNTKNQKYYYGVHSTKNLDDGYMGSGRQLSYAKKKYGKDAFSMEILKHFSSKEEMYKAEAELVIGDIVNDPLSYNEKRGGFGGWDHINSSSIMRGKNNPVHRPEVKQKMVETSRARGSYYTEKRALAQKSATTAATIANTGKNRPEHSKFMKEWATNYWKENKEFIRDKLSSTYVIISPDGVQYTTNRLGEFCDNFGLPFVTMWSLCKNKTTAKRGKCKNWFITKVNDE